jgi:hypothetical protein
MEVLRGDMTIIRGIRRGGLFEMIDMMESASTVVLADTPTYRVIGGDNMIDYGETTTVETCHMVMSALHSCLDRW